MLKVRNIIGRAGNPVKNQFIISTDESETFQSYKSAIAKKCYKTGKVYLDSHYWDYSTTTGKYRNQFLGMTKPETEKAIKAGEIILTNLN